MIPREQRKPRWSKAQEILSAFERARRAQSAALIEKIHHAFKDVTLEDGISLHQAYLINARGGTDEEMAAARKLDVETRWQDIPDDKVDTIVISFGDAKGIRFHLPRVLVYALEHPDESFYYLNLPETADASGVYEIFSQGQREAVAEVARFISRWHA